jgi:RNA polymerase sigma-70 factor (ECF subfamily)
VARLITEAAERAERLTPQPPETFYADVTALSSTVGTLRRIARTARDAAGGPAATSVTGVSVTGEAVTEEAVTEEAVTETLDEGSFAGLVESHRRELQVHCYRMTGSFDDAEDLVQEAFLRAWRGRAGFAGRSSVRTWLYRVTTNACLDFLRRTGRRPQRYEPVPGMAHGDGDPPDRITWLQPYPDELLAEMPAEAAGPDAEAVSRETVELVFLAALQHLPPRQRAVLILRDVLGLPAAEAADLLDMSTASVNSALQRARPTLRERLPERRAQWSGTPSAEERAVLERYMDAAHRGDIPAMAAILKPEVRLTMPPNPFWFLGRKALLDFVSVSVDPASPQYFGAWRHLPTRANGLPAVAGYVRRPGTSFYRAQNLDVLRIEDGRIAEITTFEPHLLPSFDLPLKLRDR